VSAFRHTLPEPAQDAPQRGETIMIEMLRASRRLRLLALLVCLGFGAAACDQAPVDEGGTENTTQ
jgi:hypothetical protein